MKSLATQRRDDTFKQRKYIYSMTTTIVYNDNKKIIKLFLTVLALAYILPVGGSLLGIYFTINPESDGVRFFLKMIFGISFISGMIWWVLNSFEKPPKDKGRFFYQLSISGVYKDWGKNVLPLAPGLCKIHPFKDNYFKVEYVPVSNETITVFNEETDEEDGEVFDLITPEKKVPVVIKWKFTGDIVDTLLFLSQDQSQQKQNLKLTIFKGIAEALNAKATSNEVTREQIKEIEEEGLNLTTAKCTLFGIKPKAIDVNSIEKTSVEQKAQKDAEKAKIEATQIGEANIIKAKKEAEARIIKAEADAQADDIASKQLRKSQSEMKSENPGLTDQEAATLALAASGVVPNVTLLAGNTPNILGIPGTHGHQDPSVNPPDNQSGGQTTP